MEALVLIDPALYSEHVTTDKKGEPILYVRMNKALYGLLKSALDFYTINYAVIWRKMISL